MLFGFITYDESLAPFLKEFEEILPQRKEKEPLSLSLFQDREQGFSLEYQKEEQSACIHYHRKHELCRALLYVYGNCGDASFFVEQTCGFSDFGIMLDCSRNAVATVDAMKRYVRYAALMGYTFIGLYTEDTLEVKEEPYFGYMRGRWTKREIKELDSYAHSFGLELRPYVQTLAHLNQAIRHKKYQDITDTGDILLIDDRRTEEFLDHLLESVSEMYQAKTVNLGMDEAEMVGLGRYLQQHGYQDRQKLMKKHLDKVLQICKKYELHPQIWSDMFFKLAFDGAYYLNDAVDEKTAQKLGAIDIPQGLDLVYWDYYHLEQETYDRMLEAHKMLTPAIVFAGGAWKWQGFAPNNRFSIKIGYAALSSCKEHDISEVVLTSWGDNGAEADMFSVLPALFMDAQYAWMEHREEAADDTDQNLFYAMTGIQLHDFLKLDDINPYIYDGTGHNCACKYFLYNDPLIGTCDSLVKENTAALYQRTTGELGKIAACESPFAYLFETEAALSEVLEHKADLGIRIKDAYDRKDRNTLIALCTEINKLTDLLEQFYRLFKKQWNKNSRSFGFEVQTVRIGGLKQRLVDTVEIIEAYLNGESKEIPELEEKRLPFDLNDGVPEKMDFNYWSKNVSPSAICW